jgi:LacI family fructose operon transcriptional repressor
MTGETTENARRPTIYDIAELAGASASAVSSVLNGTWKKRRISKKLADRVLRIADEQGYSVNVQASLLRRQKSNIVGMVIPKYDNRYFAEIAETFEALARARGLFPVITCTQRDTELEVEAARELIAYKVECVFVTGATNPDHMTQLFRDAGVQSINIDLPGKTAPSVLSDNYSGARDLSELLLHRCLSIFPSLPKLKFVGGRLGDNNTSARLRGFKDAVAARGLEVSDSDLLVRGYAPDRTYDALSGVEVHEPLALFVNSTISLEGVMRWLTELEPNQIEMVRYACFDWDPFGDFLPGIVGMARQDVREMMRRAFEMVGKTGLPNEQSLVACSILEM